MWFAPLDRGNRLNDPTTHMQHVQPISEKSAR